MSTSDASQLNVNTGELAKFLNQFGCYVLEGVKEQIKSGCDRWLNELKSQSIGQAYVDKLEKNLILYAESFHIGVSELATYIQSENKLTEAYIEKHLNNSLLLARKSVEWHQAYIRNGCLDCYVHHTHDFYTPLKEIYDSGDIEAYIDELEFSCLYYKACLMLIQLYTSTYLNNVELFESYKCTSTTELVDALSLSVKVHTGDCLDEVHIELETISP